MVTPAAVPTIAVPALFAEISNRICEVLSPCELWVFLQNGLPLNAIQEPMVPDDGGKPNSSVARTQNEDPMPAVVGVYQDQEFVPPTKVVLVPVPLLENETVAFAVVPTARRLASLITNGDGTPEVTKTGRAAKVMRTPWQALRTRSPSRCGMWLPADRQSLPQW